MFYFSPLITENGRNSDISVSKQALIKKFKQIDPHYFTILMPAPV